MPVERYSTNYERVWRSTRNIMERASRRPRTEFEYSPRTMQLREYALREFWEIFVDDRPFCLDACFRHANVRSKSVFSYAMTIMDEIYGWEDEEKRVGSKFPYLWICTTEALTRGQIPTPKLEEYFKRRLMSIMLCMNRVCAGTFHDHKWVSESTITQHVEEVMGMELDYKISIPCGTMVHVMVFSAPTRLNRTLEKQAINTPKSTTTM